MLHPEEIIWAMEFHICQNCKVQGCGREKQYQYAGHVEEDEEGRGHVLGQGSGGMEPEDGQVDGGQRLGRLATLPPTLKTYSMSGIGSSFTLSWRAIWTCRGFMHLSLQAAATFTGMEVCGSIMK